VILVVLITYGGLIDEHILKHFMYLRIDGVSMFQGVKSKIITLMRTEQTPFLIGIHCMIDGTNLVV
jgi:hypothetical protein